MESIDTNPLVEVVLFNAKEHSTIFSKPAVIEIYIRDIETQWLLHQTTNLLRINCSNALHILLSSHNQLMIDDVIRSKTATVKRTCRMQVARHARSLKIARH
jgi:hypothetical protein